MSYVPLPVRARRRNLDDLDEEDSFVVNDDSDSNFNASPLISASTQSLDPFSKGHQENEQVMQVLDWSDVLEEVMKHVTRPDIHSAINTMGKKIRSLSNVHPILAWLYIC